MLRVYLDNNVASAISRRDLSPAELVALDQLVEAWRCCRISIGSSRHSMREMERAPVQYRSSLESGLNGLEMAERDHVVLGFHETSDQYGGFIAVPLVADIVNQQLYDELRFRGLDDNDAKHVMYASENGYDRSLTCDGGILRMRSTLHSFLPNLRIQAPSELAGELRSAERR